VIEELRLIRTRLDQLAAHFFQVKAVEDLLHMWDCGHRHASRGEAIACKKLQETGKAVLEGKTSDNLVPAPAEAGS
jgi:hypothetical protein